MSGASVAGWAGHVNRHMRGGLVAATTRSASLRTGAKNVLTRAVTAVQGVEAAYRKLSGTCSWRAYLEGLIEEMRARFAAGLT
jgi:hypothetical protein